MMNQLPVIALDLDGVIHRSYVPINGVEKSFKMLRRNLSEIDTERFSDISDKIPVLCLTNSGGCVEVKKLKKLNEILNLDERESLVQKNLILNFTPLRNEMLKLKDKVVLIAGSEEYVNIAEDCQLNKYITFQELQMMYPNIVEPSYVSQQQSIDARKQVMNRIGQFEYDERHPIQVHAIFYLYNFPNLEAVIQITCDYTSTQNGVIPDHLPIQGPPTHIPVYSVLPDTLFPSKFKSLRMALGMFVPLIQNVYKQIFNSELKIIECGKPSCMTFEYAQQQGIEMCKYNLIFNKHIINLQDKS